MGGKTISTEQTKIGTIALQTSSYGLTIAKVYGTQRVSGNLLWYGNFTPIAHTTTTNSGGKGFGSITQKDTTYTYTAAVIMGLGEGAITGIGSVWKGKDKMTLAQLGLTLFNGTPTQAVWSFLSGYNTSGNWPAEAAVGYKDYSTGSTPSFTDQAINYSSTACLVSSAYDLGDQASVPNHGFEVQGTQIYGGGIVDANPADIVPDMLTSQQYGAGFPSALMGSLTAYSQWCIASGLFVSPAYADQSATADRLKELTDFTNSAVVWSGGLLKIIPYCDAPITGNSVTYTPNMTPLYDMADDDFLSDAAGAPIRVKRSSPADAKNRIGVEFCNRANDYNIEVVSVEDQLSIETLGLKPADNVTAHMFALSSAAKMAAQLQLQRLLYQRNQFLFKLNARYPMLEPMDIITLTDTILDMNRLPVRIISITELDNGFDVIAEELLIGTATAAQYAHDNGLRWQMTLNAVPASIQAPVIFEMPADPTTTGLAVGIAAGGQLTDAIYGGCRVWISLDNATYRQAGVIYGESRYGALTATFATNAAGPDATHNLAVALASGGQLISGTAADAANAQTLLVIDNEFVGYATATLTGTNAYTLNPTNRGLYGSTPAAHASGNKWARIGEDVAVLEDMDLTLIGKTVWVKCTAFNIYGRGEQQLSAATAYSYTITGWAQALGVKAALAKISDDGWLSPDEKISLINDYAYLINEKTTLDSQADAASVSRTDYDTKIGSLTTYLTGLSPAWNDTTKATAVVRATFNTKWTDAEEARRLLVVAVRASIPVTIYQRVYGTPATPTGNSPSGWTTYIPDGTATTWSSTGLKDYSGTLVGTWSTPVSLTTYTPRGDYGSTVTYFLNNTVNYNGGSYFAILDNFSGHAPSGTAQDNTYWKVLSAPGDPGAPAIPPSAFSATINLSSGAAVNLRSVADANGYTGASNATITYNVPNGVTIRGLSGSGLSGGIGLDTGSWPSGYTIALTLVVQSGGIVDGGGGAGGAGNTGLGLDGGDAIYVRVPMTGGITINSGGIVRAGGGGGGGGGRYNSGGPVDTRTICGGGGGGGGFPNGTGGAGGYGQDGSGGTGSVGTTSGGGAGGTGGTDTVDFGGAGGAGGGAATAGSTGVSSPTGGVNPAGVAGGAAGYAVRKNGNTVTVTNSGTLTGTAA